MSLAEKSAIVTGSGQGLGLPTHASLHGTAPPSWSTTWTPMPPMRPSRRSRRRRPCGGRGRAGRADRHGTDTGRDRGRAFGRLDILVTNAGILRDTVLWKMSDEDFDAVVDVHLRGTFTCVRAAAIQFREAGEGGRIICIGSPTGQRGNFGQTNYAAAKAGIVGMVRTWALELQKADVTVNAVIPVAATAMTATVPYFAARRSRPTTRASRCPTSSGDELGFGTADDAAGLIAYLASDAAAGHHRPGDRRRGRPHRSSGPIPEPVESPVPRPAGGPTRRSSPRSRRSSAAGCRVSARRSRRFPPSCSRDPRTVTTRIRVEHRRRRTRGARHPRAHRGRRLRGARRCHPRSRRRRRPTSIDRPSARPSTRSPTYYRESDMAAVVFTVDARDAARASAAEFERRDRARRRPP